MGWGEIESHHATQKGHTIKHDITYSRFISKPEVIPIKNGTTTIYYDT